MRVGGSRVSRPRLYTRRLYSRSLLELATSFPLSCSLVSPHPQPTTLTASPPRHHPPHRLPPPRRRLPPNHPHALLHRQRRPPLDRPPALLHPQCPLLHPQRRPPPDRPPALVHPHPPVCPLYRPHRRQALDRAHWPRPTYCQYPHRDSPHCHPLPRCRHHLRPLRRLRRPPCCHHHQPRLPVWARAHHRRSRRCQRPPGPTPEPKLTSSSIEILSLTVVCAGSNQHESPLAQPPEPVKHNGRHSCQPNINARIARGPAMKSKLTWPPEAISVHHTRRHCAAGTSTRSTPPSPNSRTPVLLGASVQTEPNTAQSGRCWRGGSSPPAAARRTVRPRLRWPIICPESAARQRPDDRVARDRR